jgi:acyl-CoA synthetase (AMP-forming)/AMP-acid ligase II
VEDADQNLASIWERIARTVPDALAVVQGSTSRTWGELEDRAARLATGLSRLGVGAGGRVAIDCYNCVEYLETVFAAFKLRAAPVNLNYRYRAGELAALLEDSTPSAVVFHEAVGDRVHEAASQLDRAVALVEVRDGTQRLTRADAVAFEELIDGSAPALPVRRSGDDEFILYTGGTTGRPRGVVWSHEAVFAMEHVQFSSRGLPVPRDLDELAASVRSLHEHGVAPVALIVSPLMHGTAIFNTMAAFALGGSVVLCESRSLDAHEVCRLIESYRIRQLSIVGDAFAKPILAALDAAASAGRPYDVSSLERITSVGVTWSAEVKQGLLRHADVVLVDAVAASEGGGFASAETRRGDPVGTARFQLGPNAKVVDENGKEIRPGSGEVGYLAAAGPLPKCYLNDPEKTARTWWMIGGSRYVVPGDMATIEEDGTVVLLGRGSEVVNTGGEKVFVEEVELVISAHSAVEDVLVVGVPDDRFGTRVAAVVQVAPGVHLNEQDVIDHVGASLADHKRPRQVVFVEKVPRTPAGKADRARARTMVEAAQLAPLAEATSKGA